MPTTSRFRRARSYFARFTGSLHGKASDAGRSTGECDGGGVRRYYRRLAASTPPATTLHEHGQRAVGRSAVTEPPVRVAPPAQQRPGVSGSAGVLFTHPGIRRDADERHTRGRRAVDERAVTDLSGSVVLQAVHVPARETRAGLARVASDLDRRRARDASEGRRASNRRAPSGRRAVLRRSHPSTQPARLRAACTRGARPRRSQPRRSTRRPRRAFRAGSRSTVTTRYPRSVTTRHRSLTTMEHAPAAAPFCSSLPVGQAAHQVIHGSGRSTQGFAIPAILRKVLFAAAPQHIEPGGNQRQPAHFGRWHSSASR